VPTASGRALSFMGFSPVAERIVARSPAAGINYIAT
jgi:hypothetical protein